MSESEARELGLYTRTSGPLPSYQQQFHISLYHKSDLLQLQ